MLGFDSSDSAAYYLGALPARCLHLAANRLCLACSFHDLIQPVSLKCPFLFSSSRAGLTAGVTTNKTYNVQAAIFNHDVTYASRENVKTPLDLERR